MKSLVAAALLAILVTVANAAELLAPTGPYAIGRSSFHWKRGTRDVPGYLFYPASTTSSAARAAYFPHFAEIKQFNDTSFGQNFTRNDLGTSYDAVRTMASHAIDNAPLSDVAKRYPLIVFSHGGGIPVLFYTTILEELASHGYIVAAVEHVGDGASVMLSDGRIVTQDGWDGDAARTKDARLRFHQERHRVDVLDNRFVLDHLASAPLSKRIDWSAIGAAGHSLGGMVSILSCGTDRRFQSCVNLDGGLDDNDSYGVVKQPILFTVGYHNYNPVSAEAFLAKLRRPYAKVTGEARIALIDSPRFSHFSYYDLPGSDAQVEPWKATPEEWAANLRAIRAITLRFFDHTLRGETPLVVSDLPLVLGALP